MTLDVPTSACALGAGGFCGEVTGDGSDGADTLSAIPPDGDNVPGCVVFF